MGGGARSIEASPSTPPLPPRYTSLLIHRRLADQRQGLQVPLDEFPIGAAEGSGVDGDEPPGAFNRVLPRNPRVGTALVPTQAINEFLPGSARRDVRLAGAAQESEIKTELAVHALGRVANDLQATAPGRTVVRK